MANAAARTTGTIPMPATCSNLCALAAAAGLQAGVSESSVLWLAGLYVANWQDQDRIEEYYSDGMIRIVSTYTQYM
jgi:hypothetical protein